MEEVVFVAGKIITIFVMGFWFFWFAIATGLGLGLSPVVVAVTIVASYIAGVVLVLALGSRAREWIFRRLGRRAEPDPNSFLGRIWTRYGVVGLGLAAPMTTGSMIGAAIAIALNARPRHVLVWMSVGAIGWSIVLTTLFVMGIIGAQAVVQ